MDEKTIRSKAKIMCCFWCENFWCEGDIDCETVRDYIASREWKEEEDVEEV